MRDSRLIRSFFAPLQIAHYPTLRSIPSETSVQVLEEVELYKQALKKCFEKFGADMIVFEMARTTGKGGHAHIQVSRNASTTLPVIPLPAPEDSMY